MIPNWGGSLAGTLEPDDSTEAYIKKIGLAGPENGTP